MSYSFKFPIEYIPDPAIFGDVALGSLYIGVVDGDPAANPADQIQAYVARQGLSDLAIDQPIQLSAGGVPTYNGSPVTIKVNSQYSVAIRDILDNQVYYSPKSGEEITELASLDTRVDQLEANETKILATFLSLANEPSYAGKIVTIRCHTSGAIGGGQFIAVAGSVTNNGGTQINSATGGIYWERINCDFLTPAMFGGIGGTGAADDTLAISLAIDEAIRLGKGAVKLPAGRFRITSKITKTLTGIKGFSFTGEGMGVTEILVDYDGGDGFEFIADSGNYWLDVGQRMAIRIAELTFVTNRINVGTGVKINGGVVTGRPPAAAVFEHVEWRGATSFSHAFAIGISLVDCGSTQFNGCRWIGGGPGFSTGVGLQITASAAGKDPTEHKITDGEWYFCSAGVNAGDYVEGVYFNNPSMVNCDKGIRWITTTGESGLVVNGGHFNCFSRNIEIDNVFDVSITGPIMYHADASAGFRHISLKTCGAFNIQGHTLRGGATDSGIFVESVPIGWGGTIGAGEYRGLGVGVYLDTASTNVTVHPGAYQSVTTRVVNLGTVNTVMPRIFSYTVVVALVGGAATEVVNIPIPSGYFLAAKPLDAVAQINGAFNLLMHYDRDNAGTTATNAMMVVVPGSAATVPAGNYRVTATIFGD